MFDEKSLRNSLRGIWTNVWADEFGFRVVYVDTEVFRYDKTYGIVLNNGGFLTRTTCSRMNDCLSLLFSMGVVNRRLKVKIKNNKMYCEGVGMFNENNRLLIPSSSQVFAFDRNMAFV